MYNQVGSICYKYAYKLIQIESSYWDFLSYSQILFSSRECINPITTFREDPSPRDQNFHRCYALLKFISSKVTKHCLHKMCSELQAKLAQTDRRICFLSGESKYMTAVRLHIRICCSHHTIPVARIMDLYHFYGNS